MTAGRDAETAKDTAANLHEGDIARREIIASIAQLERLLEVLGGTLHHTGTSEEYPHDHG